MGLRGFMVIVIGPDRKTVFPNPGRKIFQSAAKTNLSLISDSATEVVLKGLGFHTIAAGDVNVAGQPGQDA